MTIEVRPNNNLFYQPTCVINTSPIGNVYVDYYDASGDSKVKHVRFGAMVAPKDEAEALQRLADNMSEAWADVMAFMGGHGVCDLKVM